MANWFTRLFSGPVLAESAPAKANPNLPRKVVVQTSPVGSSGTDLYSGYFHEEYLRELQGRPAADIYDRMRRSDPRVKMCLSAVKNPIKGATWEIDPAGDDDAAKAHADLVRHALFEDMDKSWKEFLSEALSFVDFGHSVFEVVHKVVRDNPRYGSYNGIQSFGFRSQRTIERWNLEKTGQLKSITQMAYGDLESHKDISGQFLVVFSLEKEGDNYEGISALRTCYGPFFRKDLYLKLMAIGIEKTAVPTPKAKIPTGQQTSEQYANLIATLEAYTSHQQNYITYPEGWDINFDQTKFDASGVKSAIEFEDAQMVFSFLANFLNLGQSGAGSFALSVDLSDFFLAGIEHVADIVTEKFNRQIIPDLIKLNFGPQENYPKLKCSGISDKPGGELGKLLKDLAESKYITPDDRLEKHLRKRIGLPEVSEEGKREVGPTAPASFSDVKKKPEASGEMKPVYLICGVSGSGKTWVCKQLTEKFLYIPHDEHFNDHAAVLLKEARKSSKPLITEAPFGERVLREELEDNGCKVLPFFVIEDPELIAQRYFHREGKEISKSAYSRAATIVDRAEEWGAFHGTADAVLKKLQSLKT